MDRSESAKSPVVTNRKRRWPSGVGLLMLIVAAVSIPIATVANRVREQKRLIELIQRPYGSVVFDFEIGSDGLPNGKKEPSAPRWLRRIVGDDPFGPSIR